jgi:hypothetical protein
MKSARNSWADHVPDRLQKEVYPGAEIPFVPVEPDVLDGGDVVEGAGVGFGCVESAELELTLWAGI